jgi:hypothetical protein
MATLLYMGQLRPNIGGFECEALIYITPKKKAL